VNSSPLSSSGLAIVNAARIQEIFRYNDASARCDPKIRCYCSVAAWIVSSK
jgi:hypothetical protein